MIVEHDLQALQRQCQKWREQGLRIALVPTMGFFHEGHESLMTRARQLADKVVVSLFVNPAQFGPAEDLQSYPRDPERDSAIAAKHGVDVLFAPSVEDMYPEGFGSWVDVPVLSNLLCGASRPGHFKGVCTVVMKLFQIIAPHYAVFGQKDRQQLTVIRRMAADLNIPVRIEGAPIVREADGLALSSRNSYLTHEGRAAAPHIYKGLCLARALLAQGQRDAETLRAAVLEYWTQTLPQGRVDYLACVDPATFRAASTAESDTIMLTAVFLGRARLIDNVILGE